MSCKKEGDVYQVKDGSFNGNALSASSAAIVLAQADEEKEAVSFSWDAADFGEKPAVQYTLQLAVDTANSWSNAKSFSAGAGKTGYAFIGKDLNNMLNAMGLAAGTPSDIAVRIKAEVLQNNGTASTIKPVYSNTLLLEVTTYSLSLYIPGDYQGWNPAAAPLLNPVEGKPGLYEGYVYMPGSGAQYFKYTNAPDWDHTNYGDGGNGTFSTDGLAAGLSVPDGGYYQLTADLNNNKWTATKTSWSIIGDATPGGWDTDTQMAYDPDTQTWTLTCDMQAGGSFKFRANNAWAIDFGMDPATGKLVYADHPLLGYTPDLWNLSVPSSGNYTITLDLHISQQYTYTLTKN
ncbi:hypothetical protein CCY01nite_43010 [Chitinophaga cymbidii]|uniref:SusE outer membrane protein domain-containing protein n=2 Tax=Chitinophaga cymbidii TaxID=1096750 RepID=A0A512RQQ3_9BACT|nr:hypothetical protein CCY01nite_43010 [Chitinophaga cymbidii]